MRLGELLEDAELLLASGKSVLLTGPPGTGKTRSARLLVRRFTGSEPVVIVGRVDLSYKDLLVREEGGSLELGPLALSALSSWVRLCAGCPPAWLLIDEVNRMDVDVVLGDLMMALDAEHRLYTPLIRRHLAERILGDERVMKEVADAASAGCEGVTLGEARRCIAGVLEMHGFIPLPLSWRLVATMNYVDRAALFRLGFALLRRLPPVLYTGIEWRPSMEYRRIIDCGALPVRESLEYAARELCMTNPRMPRDRLTPVAAQPGELREALCSSTAARRVLSLVYEAAARLRRAGVELGPAVLTDAARLLMTLVVFAGGDERLLDELAPDAADVVLASLLLPQASTVAPKARMEIVLTGVSRRLALLEDTLEWLRRVLGEKSRVAWYAEVLSLELPLHTERG